MTHLVGTAGVLVRYDFSAGIVAVGMLHAAYSHAPPREGGPGAAAQAVCAALGGRGSDLERRVRAYTQRELIGGGLPLDPDLLTTLSVFEAETIAIWAANEVEMLSSGEFRYSGRTDAIASDTMRQVAHVCRILGVSGLSETLGLARREQVPVRAEMQTGIDGSYRIGADRRSRVPMVSPAPLPLDESGG